MLLSTISESLNIPLDQIIPAMKKDILTKALFTRDYLTLANRSPAALERYKRYFFNNPEVVAWVNEYGGKTPRFSKWIFNNIRKLQLTMHQTLTDSELSDIKDQLQYFFRDHRDAGDPDKQEKQVANDMYDALSHLRKFHDSGLGAPGSRWTVLENALARTRGIRGVGTVRAYKMYAFRDRRVRPGTSSDPLRTLLSMQRPGSKRIDLKLGGLSLWTTSLKSAKSLINSRGTSEVAFLITAVLPVDAVLIDGRFSKFGGLTSDEVLVKEVPVFDAMIAHRYGVGGIEEPVIPEQNDDAEVAATGLQLLKDLVTPSIIGEFHGHNGVRFSAAALQECMNPTAVKRLQRQFTLIKAYYNQHLTGLNKIKIATLFADQAVATAIQTIVAFMEYKPRQWPPPKQGQSPDVTKHHEMSFDEVLETKMKRHLLKSNIQLVINPTYSRNYDMSVFELAHGLKVSIPSDIHRQPKAVQVKFLTTIRSELCAGLGLQPDASADTIIDTFLPITQVGGMAQSINEIAESLQAL